MPRSFILKRLAEASILEEVVPKSVRNLVSEFSEKVLVKPEHLGGHSVIHKNNPFTLREFESFTHAWKTLTEEFPSMPSLLTRIEIGGSELVDKAIPGAMAITTVHPGRLNKQLTKDLFSREDPRAIKALSHSSMVFSVPRIREAPGKLKAQYAFENAINLPHSDPMLADPSAGGTLTHEFGHALMNAGMSDLAARRELPVINIRTGIINRLAGTGNTLSGFPSPTKYGASHPFEAFAESFTDVVRHPNPNPISIDQMEFWNRVVAPEFQVETRYRSFPEEFNLSAAERLGRYTGTALRHKERLQESIRAKKMFGF